MTFRNFLYFKFCNCPKSRPLVAKNVIFLYIFATAGINLGKFKILKDEKLQNVIT